jgi:uncharacterized surface protein with fasciclin (FAS1) repeats
MKKRLNIVKGLVLACVVGLTLFVACRDEMEGKTFLTSDDVMMDDYIVQQDTSMLAFLEIADRADFRGTLHAYGLYSCFVPTNSAVKLYLRERNKSSVQELSVEECEQIVRYHVVRHDVNQYNKDEVTTAYFVDGRLPWATMLAKYLTTRMVNNEGDIMLRVNRQANVLRKDIDVANGYIHKVDRVLTPPEMTCGEQVEALPDSYSLFREVMKSTGWVDSLTNHKANGEWYSVFLQSNESLATVGITTVDSLVGYLRPKVNIDIDEDLAMVEQLEKAGLEVSAANMDKVLLWIFAAYHSSKGLYYVADLMKTSSIASLSPDQVLTFKIKQDSLLVNEFINTAAKQHEAGVPVDKISEYTDMSCYNGVLVDVAGYIGPQKRGAQAIYWEITEQPELMKNSKFKKATIPITWDELQTYTEMKVTLASGVSSYAEADFRYEYTNSYTVKEQRVSGDALAVNWNKLASMELTLPLLTPGKYNVWVCFRRADVNSNRVRATFLEEGQEAIEMGTVGFHDYLDISTEAAVLLGQGMKRYTAKERVTSMNSMRWGTMQVKTTGRHKLRLDVIDRGRSTPMWVDMIHFIPTDQDQLWPRFDMKGTAIMQGTACDQIYPFANSCSSNNDDK